MKTILALLTLLLACACTPAAVTPPPDACADAASPLDKKKCPACPCSADAAPAPAPTPAPVPDAAPAPLPTSGYVAVCQHLATLGCQEGANPSCATLIGKVQDASLGDLKPSCLLAAGSVVAVQACGTVACTVSAAKKKK
jgi:hypothetical protein